MRYLLIPVLLVGCQGVIGDAPADQEVPRLPDSIVLDPASCDTPDLVAAAEHGPLRLLTRGEFERTLAMILGEEIAVEELLLPDRRLEDGPFPSNRGRVLNAQDNESLRLVAERAAAVVRAHPERFLACDGVPDDGCVAETLRALMRRAFRRPATPDEVTRLTRVYDLGSDVAEGLALSANAVFLSPDFVYHVELADGPTTLTAYELAARIAFFVTGRGPDDALLRAAESGELGDAAVVEAMTRELFRSPAGQSHTLRQLVRWIGVETMRAKEAEHFPGEAVGPEALAEVQRSMEEYLGDLVFEEGAGVGEWFVHPHTNETAFHAGDVAETPRVGILTHPAWLAAFSGGAENIPTARGKFIATDLLCMHIELPTATDIVIPPVLPDDGVMTVRQRFEQHGDMPCATACHRVMDPLGYAFEDFDAVGRYQTEDNGQPIDATGEIDIPSLSLTGEFENAADLAEMLSESRALQTCFSRRWFEQALSRSAGLEEGCSIAALAAPVLDTGAHLEDLTVAIVQSPHFHQRSPNLNSEGVCQ